MLWDTHYLAMWARAFAVTQLVEAPLYRATLRASWGRALAPSALTHPLVWFVFPRAGEALGLPYGTWVTLAEVFAVVAEAAFFAATSPRAAWSRALGASLLANAASVAVALVGRATIGLP